MQRISTRTEAEALRLQDESVAGRLSVRTTMPRISTRTKAEALRLRDENVAGRLRVRTTMQRVSTRSGSASATGQINLFQY